MNKRTHIKSFLLILACYFCTSVVTVVGQNIDTIPAQQNVDLPSEQVEVIKLFQARLEDAKKINILPESPPSRKLEAFNYQVNIRPIDLEYLEPVIRPVAMIADPKPEKYNAFLKGGYGNLNSIYGKIGYNYSSARETEINVQGDYISMNNKDRSFHKYENINSSLNINHNVGPLLAVGINAGYRRKNINFFGSPFDGLESDTRKYNRIVNKYGVGVNVYNGETNVYDVNYDIGLNYENLSLAKEKLSEHNFIADLKGKKAINENFTVGFQGQVDISSILDTATTNYNNYFISPALNYVNDQLSFEGGVNFAFTKDKTYYLPNVLLSYSPFDYGFIPYIFWKGELRKNNLSNLIEVNPFISNTIIPQLSNSVSYNYGIGVKGAVSTLTYDASVSYGNTDDLVLYNSVVNADLLRQFVLIKDTANILEISAGVAYEVNDNFSIDADFRFRNFELKKEIRAWHLPVYHFDLEVKYTLLDQKLLINPRMYLRDGAYSRSEDGIAEKLNPLVDFNLNLEYKIRERISAFGQVNNILSSEYQRWDEYSQFGLNALLGLKVSF